MTAGIAMAALVGSQSHAEPATRSVSRPYTIHRLYVHLSDVDGYVGTMPEFIRARAHERWLTVSLEDSSGLPVRGRVQFGRKVGSKFAEFCSTTPRPIRVRPGQQIGISAILGRCGNNASVVTDGRIRATFTRARP